MPGAEAARRLDTVASHLPRGSRGGAAARAAPSAAELRVPRSHAPVRAHVVCGGYMVVTNKLQGDHNINYVRRRLLGMMDENEERPIWATVANDYSELERWLRPETKLLVSYCSAPYANDTQTAQIQAWLEGGGRWVALHGSSGGKAVRVKSTVDTHPFGGQRKFVKQRFHDTLGAFFMNHPPIREFPVTVTDPSHPIALGVPPTFAVEDELYMVQLQGDKSDYKVFLQTEYVPGKELDPSHAHFVMDFDPAPDGKTRALGYERKVGKGAVVYIALGHTNTASKQQPRGYAGVWENPAYEALLRNAIAWGARA